MFITKKYTMISIKTLFIIAFLYFFWLMLRITLEYVPARPDVGFLMIKQTEVEAYPEYLPIFYIHVYTSIFVLLLGFIALLRINFGISYFHQWVGKGYVFLLLVFAAPSGIYMGIHANGGELSVVAFLILGILWWWTTFKAYQTARQKDFTAHKRWMWRSIALSVSALTLRMWKVIIVYFFQLPPMDTYQIIAWLGWVPNLLLVEYLIKRKII